MALARIEDSAPIDPMTLRDAERHREELIDRLVGRKLAEDDAAVAPCVPCFGLPRPYPPPH